MGQKYKCINKGSHFKIKKNKHLNLQIETACYIPGKMKKKIPIFTKVTKL